LNLVEKSHFGVEDVVRLGSAWGERSLKKVLSQEEGRKPTGTCKTDHADHNDQKSSSKKNGEESLKKQGKKKGARRGGGDQVDGMLTGEKKKVTGKHIATGRNAQTQQRNVIYGKDDPGWDRGGEKKNSTKLGYTFVLWVLLGGGTPWS